MANELAAGIWPCLVLGAEAGEVDRKIVARINVKFTEGPNKDRYSTYEDAVDARSSLYVGRSLKAVGWKGKSLATVKGDCDAWIKETGGASTAEIKHIEVKKGKKYDKWAESGYEGPAPIWDKCSSIGRGPKPMKAASGETLADAEEAMQRAMAEDNTRSESTDTGGGFDADAPLATDDIPFATIGRIGLGEIAKVLR